LTDFAALPGLPLVVMPPEFVMLATPFFAGVATPTGDVPDRDDSTAWAACRRRALYFWPGHEADALMETAQQQGCSRCAVLEQVPDIHDLDGHDPHSVLRAAKAVASARATAADLSVLDPPAGRPRAIPFAVYGALAPALQAAARYAGTPPDFVAAAGLPILAGITGGVLAGMVSESHAEPVIMAAVLLGAPGANKTGALRAFEPAIEAIEAQLASDYELAMARWEALTAGMPKGSRPKPPARELLRLMDFTPESLAYALHKNKRGLISWVPEFSSLGPGLGLGGAEGYSKTGSMRATLLRALLDGGPSVYSRRSAGDAPLAIAHFAAPMVTTAQPDVFSELLRHPLRDGLADRFLIAMPAYRPAEDLGPMPTTPFAAVSSTLRDGLTSLYRKVCDLASTAPGGVIRIPFEPAAATAWGLYSKEQKLRAAAMNDLVGGARIKATAHAARIAALGAFIDHVLENKPLVVTASKFAQARHMMRALLDHRAVAEAIAFEPIDERRARALARAIVAREAALLNPVEIRRTWAITNLRTEAELRSALIELQMLGWFRNTSPVSRNTRDPLPSTIELDPIVLREARILLKG
jgi:hypothetical protein